MPAMTMSAHQSNAPSPWSDAQRTESSKGIDLGFSSLSLGGTTAGASSARPPNLSVSSLSTFTTDDQPPPGHSRIVSDGTGNMGMGGTPPSPSSPMRISRHSHGGAAIAGGLSHSFSSDPGGHFMSSGQQQQQQRGGGPQSQQPQSHPSPIGTKNVVDMGGAGGSNNTIATSPAASFMYDSSPSSSTVDRSTYSGGGGSDSIFGSHGQPFPIRGKLPPPPPTLDSAGDREYSNNRAGGGGAGLVAFSSSPTETGGIRSGLGALPPMRGSLNRIASDSPRTAAVDEPGVAGLGNMGLGVGKIHGRPPLSTSQAPPPGMGMGPSPRGGGPPPPSQQGGLHGDVVDPSGGGNRERMPQHEPSSDHYHYHQQSHPGSLVGRGRAVTTGSASFDENVRGSGGQQQQQQLPPPRAYQQQQQHHHHHDQGGSPGGMYGRAPMDDRGHGGGMGGSYQQQPPRSQVHQYQVQPQPQPQQHLSPHQAPPHHQRFQGGGPSPPDLGGHPVQQRSFNNDPYGASSPMSSSPGGYDTHEVDSGYGHQQMQHRGSQRQAQAEGAEMYSQHQGGSDAAAYGGGVPGDSPLMPRSVSAGSNLRGGANVPAGTMDGRMNRAESVPSHLMSSGAELDGSGHRTHQQQQPQPHYQDQAPYTRRGHDETPYGMHQGDQHHHQQGHMGHGGMGQQQQQQHGHGSSPVFHDDMGRLSVDGSNGLPVPGSPGMGQGQGQGQHRQGYLDQALNHAGHGQGHHQAEGHARDSYDINGMRLPSPRRGGTSSAGMQHQQPRSPHASSHQRGRGPIVHSGHRGHSPEHDGLDLAGEHIEDPAMLSHMSQSPVMAPVMADVAPHLDMASGENITSVYAHLPPPQASGASMGASTSGMSGMGGPRVVYNVKFKRMQRGFVLGSPHSLHGAAPREADIRIGAYVKVEADRGEDLGIVVGRMSAERYDAVGRFRPPTGENMGGTGTMDSSPGAPPSPGAVGVNTSARELKRILRLATRSEVSLLSIKRDEEDELLSVCRAKVRQRNLPMTVRDAEYQFDRHKLTFFFVAEGRIDFRELVRDLFSMYKTRIWMQQLDKGCVSPGSASASSGASSGAISPVHEVAAEGSAAYGPDVNGSETCGGEQGATGEDNRGNSEENSFEPERNES